MDNNFIPIPFNLELLFQNESFRFQEITGIVGPFVDSVDDNSYKKELPGTVDLQNVTLKRGLVSANSKLMEWCNSISGDLTKAPEIYDVLIILWDSNNNAVKKWVLHKAYPVKFEYLAYTDDLEVESLELAYSFFDEIK